MNAEELMGLVGDFGTAADSLALRKISVEELFPSFRALESAIREVCAERDRLQAELDRARKELFDLKIEANNPAWL
jgi:hypothetical protein